MTTIQLSASTAWRDPQSGPRQAVGGFYHCSLAWVRGVDGAISGLRVANYIDREGRTQGHNCVPGQLLSHDLSHYIDRKGTFLSTEPEELGAAILISKGLPVENGQQLARLLDARERKADRTYRCYGGQLPRVASHLIASYSYGITSEQAGRILRDFATALSDRLGVPIYGRIHNKDRRPDHIHLLIGTRSVKDGKLGPKVRALDAVSEKIAGDGIDVGDGKLIGKTCDWMRSEWARLQREASRDEQIDHRSYARRGLDIVPVTHVAKSEIEWEKRHGSEAWRNRRQNELSNRRTPDRPTAFHAEHVANAEPDLTERDNAREPNRVDASAVIEASAHALLTSLMKPISPERGDSDPLTTFLQGTFGIDIPTEVLEAALRRSIISVHTPGRDVDAAQPKFSAEAELDPSSHKQPRSSSNPETAETQIAAAVNVSSVRHPDDVAAAIALYRRLQHAHRRETAYTERIAEWVGIDVVSFEAMAKQDMEDNPTRPLIVPSPERLPPELWSFWEKWRDDDNAKRRNRRANNRGASDPTLAQFKNSPEASYSPPREPLRDPLSVGPDAEQRPSLPTEGTSAPIVYASDAGPNGTSRDDLQPPSSASGLLEEALLEAFASEVQARHLQQRQPAPQGQDLGRHVAVLLRATGRGADEVAAVLTRDAVAKGSTWSASWVGDCVAHAFSAETTRRLAARPSFVTRARWIEGATETKLYRRLRRVALDELKADLDQVWLNRQLQADEARRRHAAWLSVLHEIRWRTRRLRRRGLVLFVLSLLVERAVVLPLMARQNAMATAERQAINARAAKLNTELNALRDDWRSMTPEQARTVFSSQSPPDEAVTNIMGDLLARVIQKATPPQPAVSPLTVEERRSVAADVALVIIARGLWTEDVGNRLARLIPSDRAALRNAAYHQCRRAFGHGTPHQLAEPDIRRLWAGAMTTAKSRDWAEMVEHMRGVSGPRPNRDAGRGTT